MDVLWIRLPAPDVEQERVNKIDKKTFFQRVCSKSVHTKISLKWLTVSISKTNMSKNFLVDWLLLEISSFIQWWLCCLNISFTNHQSPNFSVSVLCHSQIRLRSCPRCPQIGTKFYVPLSSTHLIAQFSHAHCSPLGHQNLPITFYKYKSKGPICGPCMFDGSVCTMLVQVSMCYLTVDVDSLKFVWWILLLLWEVVADVTYLTKSYIHVTLYSRMTLPDLLFVTVTTTIAILHYKDFRIADG